MNWPQMPGIDFTQGLAIVQGKTQLYRKLLLRFQAHYRDFEDQFRDAQHDPDPSAASRCVHSLKGVAGNIGAREVEQAARSLEQACKQDSAEVEKQLINLVNQLNILLDSLSQLELAEDQQKVSGNQPLDLPRVKLLIQDIFDLMAQNNIKAADKLENLKHSMTQGDYQQSLKKLSVALANYDYTQGQRILRGIADRLGNDL